MYIKASKAMCKEINKFFKEKSIPYYAVHTRCRDFEQYRWNADMDAYETDCEYDKNYMYYYQYITIVYPSECYAMPAVLTTRQLVHVFREFKPSLLPEFLECMYERLIAI